MIKLNNKVLTIVVNFFLAIWQLPQIIVGFVMLAVFRNRTKYTNPNNGITVWNINSGRVFGTACFSTGPIIITCEGVSEDTLKHETGHSLSSIKLGWFYHIIISIPSICFFWYRKIKKKDMDWYYSCWTEAFAERNGMTDRYKARMEKLFTDYRIHN